MKQSYTVQHSSQFDIVYIWISKFDAFVVTVYQLLPVDINISTTFIGFQIAVYGYVVPRTFAYKSQVARVNAQRASRLILWLNQLRK